MTDESASALARDDGRAAEVAVSPQDREILRRLAGRVAELAARPIEHEKRRLWTRHNDLEPTRALIFCDPENGWNEIITPDRRECTGELARTWEMTLRKEIFWGEDMGDDRVIEPRFELQYVYTESDWGMHETRIGGENGGAYTWQAPLKSYDDLDKLRFPAITVDHAATNDLVSLAGETFGDLLDVRLRGRWWWSLGMTWTLIKLRGLTQVMLDVYDHPEELHRLMAVLRDGTLAKLDWLEKNGLLGLNTEAYVGSGGFGYTAELPQTDFDREHVRTRDTWGFCESQETSTASPEMFKEFVFQYQLPILERFGLNCYGCCEPLDGRWHIVKRTPRLRRVSVSPWSDLAGMAANLGDRYIYSLKPHPADLAVPSLDEPRIRAGLRKALELTHGCRLEIIMKDNHTIGGNPQNVTRWSRIARQEAESA